MAALTVRFIIHWIVGCSSVRGFVQHFCPFVNYRKMEPNFSLLKSSDDENISRLHKRMVLKRSSRRHKEEHTLKFHRTGTADHCSFRKEENSRPKDRSVTIRSSVDETPEEIITEKSNRKRYKRVSASRGELNLIINTNVFTWYESKEVKKFKNVYYLGRCCTKRPQLAGKWLNYGYDDTRGFYRVVKHDHLYYRYECLEPLGKGGDGEVIKAYDHKTKRYVAIKITRNLEDAALDAEKEIGTLRLIAERDVYDNMNLVHLKHFFYFRNHTCLVLELLDASLRQLLERNFFAVTASNAPECTVSIFKGLLALKQLNITHGDIKPDHLLKRSNTSSLKICDFGHNDIIGPERRFTCPYRQNRWYQAPEVILGLPYSTPIDTWSVGCVIAEIYSGRPLLPGKDAEDQFALIVELLGPPPFKMVCNSPFRDRFFNDQGRPRYLPNSCHHAGRSNKCLNCFGLPGTRRLSAIIRDEDIANLVESCLRWNPEKRIAPEEALKHVSLRDYV